MCGGKGGGEGSGFSADVVDFGVFGLQDAAVGGVDGVSQGGEFGGVGLG